MLRTILPEAYYKAKEDLDLSKCIKAYEENETIHGTVTELIEDEEYLSVRLGENFYAKLPFSEVSIYPLKYSKNADYKFPFQIYTLMTKQISAKILSIHGNEVILSRKNNMAESFEILKNYTNLNFHVLKISKTDVFGDVGDGIYALLPIYELCKARIRSPFEIVYKGEHLMTKVILCEEDKHRFKVSYKNIFDEYNTNNYTKGDIITCVVNEPVDQMFSGFFANISPQVVGIIDNDYYVPKLYYGDKVDCVVTGISKKGLHLKFLEYTYS